MTSQDQRDEHGNLRAFGLRVPTAHPCPSWCTNGHGHGYDNDLVPGFPSRWHEAIDESFEVEDTHLLAAAHKEVGVSVHTLETVDAASGRVVWIEEPELWLGADDVVKMTAAEARRLASALLRGADLLETIQAEA